MEDKVLIEMDIADAIMEKPYSFYIGERHFFMYQPTLGHLYMIQPILQGMGMSEALLSINPYAEALRVCTAERERACRIVAYLTINKKIRIFKDSYVQERMQFFMDNLELEELAQLLILALTYDKTQEFIKYLGLDREQRDKERVMKAKEDKGNTFTFGGKSTYGTLISIACQQLGLTPNQVVWEISYVNLKMMLADNITSVHLTDEEKKKCPVSSDRTYLSGDDASNMEKIKALFND